MFAGLIKLHVGQDFHPEEGLEVIRQRISHSRAIDIHHIPVDLLQQLIPLLSHKRISLQFPAEMELNLPESLNHKIIHTHRAVQGMYHGRLVNIGTIRFPSIMFDLLWEGERTLDISSINVSRCLACTSRHRLRLDGTEDVLLGSIWPAHQGLDRLAMELEKAQGGIISNVPGEMLKPFIPRLKGKGFKLVLPADLPIPPQLRELPDLRQFPPIVETTSCVYGQTVCCGGICLPDIYLGIGWSANKIISMRSFEYPQCVSCLSEAYRMSWLFGQRIH